LAVRPCKQALAGFAADFFVSRNTPRQSALLFEILAIFTQSQIWAAVILCWHYGGAGFRGLLWFIAGLFGARHRKNLLVLRSAVR
jgi:hypothetical protein